jgi:NDP-sugar pyrophosphorylase family protein
MKGMILAAGFGTRFRPATFETPKPLVPLCNRPLIAWPLEAMLADGVDELVVNLHHLPELLEGFLRDRYGSRCAIHVSREEQILGTGGGVRRARRWLDGDEPFVLANGDTVQRPPFAELAAACRREDALATLLLRHPPDNDRFTPVWFEQGRVTGFHEGRGDALMFAGAHAISPRIFDLLPERDFSGITEDVYIPATREKPGTLAGIVRDDLWFDIGTPERYLDATAALLSRMLDGTLTVPDGSELENDSLLDEEAGVEGRIEASVIGRVAHIAKGADVTRSVLWERSDIGPGATVVGSIVGRGVRIPERAEIRNALVCRRLENVDYPEGTIAAGSTVAVPIGRRGIHLSGLA